MELNVNRNNKALQFYEHMGMRKLREGDFPIALATTFFKNRFSKSERQSGITNYVMGLAFITEGAIPFAAADPLHVIPATAVGAAVAGALSMVFGCTLMAPHGGIFVFPVVGNWPMYLVALAAGSVITMFMLALLKKPVYKEN